MISHITNPKCHLGTQATNPKGNSKWGPKSNKIDKIQIWIPKQGGLPVDTKITTRVQKWTLQVSLWIPGEMKGSQNGPSKS